MPIPRKPVTPVIDSRHLKVLAAKKADLKDSIVFVCLSEDKFGHVDKARLRQMIADIDKIEPDGIYFPMLKKINIEFYDRSEFRNRKILVTLDYDNPDEIDTDEIEKEIRAAIPEAKEVSFIHRKATIE